MSIHAAPSVMAELSRKKSATLTDLPVELLFAVVRLLPKRHSLCVLASLCKYLNNVVTPLIYEELKFAGPGDLTRALGCCITLRSSSRLAPLVRSFHIGPLRRYQHAEPSDDLRRLIAEFIRCLARLSSLRHLGYEETVGFDATACQALSYVAEQLESLTLHLHAAQLESVHGQSPKDLLSGIELCFPRLSKLQINNAGLSGYEALLRQLAKSAGASMRTLTLANCDDRNRISSLFPPEVSWSSLETLTIRLSVVGVIPAASTGSIKSLRVHGTAEPVYSYDAELDPEAFPALRWLQCYHSALPHILPKATGLRRPVDTVLLSRDLCRQDVIKSVPAVLNSAVTVTALTLSLFILDPGSFDLSSIATSLAGLRHLKIQPKCLYNGEKLGQLGAGILVHTPHLCTFSISDHDVPSCLALDDDLAWQRDIIDGWGDTCPGLRRVSLTGQFVWKRRVAGRTEWRVTSK